METGTRYSDEFKASVIRRIQFKEITASEAQRQYGMALSTLIKWRKKLCGNNISYSTTNSKDAMSKLTLPKGINYLQAYKAVVAKQLLSEVDFGKYCRQQGITVQQVNDWSVWFTKHPNAVSSEQYQQSQQNLKTVQKHAQSLEHQIERKDKALAESAQMLLLSKNARAIFGDCPSRNQCQS